MKQNHEQLSSASTNPKKKVRKMKRFLSNTTTLLIFMVPVFGQRASNCSMDRDLVGYSTIQDINLDMQEFVANTTGGENVFRLCPRTVFNVSEPLMPILSNATFACGSNNSVEDECIFDGGSVQVMIGDISTNVTFKGLTFRNFSETSIRAFAPKDSVVEFANCIWTVSSYGLQKCIHGFCLFDKSQN
jgi:hypothetical protein